MIQERETFLKDLIALLSQHGPAPFLELASALTNPEQRESVMRGLTALAEIAAEMEHRGHRVHKGPRRPSEDEKARSLLASLRVSHSRKADVLTQLYDGLKARRLLASKGDVLQFCSHLDIPVSSRAQRNKLVLPVLRHLADLSFDEVESAMQRAATMSGKPGRDFRLLANAIMKRPSAAEGDPSDAGDASGYPGA